MNDSKFTDIRIILILFQQLIKFKYILSTIFIVLLMITFYFYKQSKTSEKWETFLEYSELSDLETSYLLDYSSRLITEKNPKLYFNSKNYFNLFSKSLKMFQINNIYEYDYNSEINLKYVLKNDEIYFINLLKSLNINYFEKRIQLSFISYSSEDTKKNLFYVESIIEGIILEILNSISDTSNLLLAEMNQELEILKQEKQELEILYGKADKIRPLIKNDFMPLIKNDYGKIIGKIIKTERTSLNLKTTPLNLINLNKLLKSKAQRITLFKAALEKIFLLKNIDFPLKKNFIRTNQIKPSYNSSVLFRGIVASLLFVFFLLIILSLPRLFKK